VEARRNRRFTWKLLLGIALTFAFFSFLTDRDLRRARSGVSAQPPDPAAYRRRLAWFALALLPGLVLVIGYHAQDALERGQSIVPVVLGLGLVLGILGAVFFFVARKGPDAARVRAAKLMRWLVPVAFVVALLRLLAFAFGH